MSFIYKDESLINKLIRLAQNAQPTTPVPQKTNDDYLNIAKKLVKNLQEQITGPGVFTAERDDAAVRTTHLQNLTSLFSFLSFNGIKFNSQQIVIPNKYENIRTTSEGKEYYDYLKNNGYFEYPSNQEKPQYYINKSGLVSYLKDLQSKNNPILNAMVSKLIEQANIDLKLDLTKDNVQKENVNDNNPKEPHRDVASGGEPAGIRPIPEANALQLLNQSIEELPFDTQDIDFNRINKFFETYKKLLPNNPQRDAVLQAMQQAQDSMRNAQTTTQINRDTFPMYNLTPNMVQSWLKPPQGQYYDSLLQALLGVINNTEYVVHNLYNSYARRPSTTSRVVLNAEQENLVQQQIIGSSKYRSNFNTIKQMESRLGEVKQGK